MEHTPGFLAIVEDAKRRVKEITVAEYASQKEQWVLIDVREESEWKAGHAAGAIPLGKGIIERDIETRIPERDARLVLYCGGGYRSALAADTIQRMGYTNVWSLAGGWRAWKAAELPIES